MLCNKQKSKFWIGPLSKIKYSKYTIANSVGYTNFELRVEKRLLRTILVPHRKRRGIRTAPASGQHEISPTSYPDFSPSILLRFHQLASQPNWLNNLPPKTHLLIAAFWAVAES